MAVKTNMKVNGKNYYRITVDIGIDANGKRIRKQFVGKSKKEAEDKKNAYLEKNKAGLVDEKLYLGPTMKTWLYEVVKTGPIKASSFARYAGIYSNYFENSPISSVLLDKIKPIDIQRYYNSLNKDGKSSNVILNANKLLKQFFNYCVDNGYMLTNPCAGKKVVIPKNDTTSEKTRKKEISIFSTDEMKKILNNREDTKIRYLALFSYATGMRRGEILALKEDDIDYENKEIHISKTLITSYIYDDEGNKHKETFIDNTKTYSSIRDIPLPNDLIPIIKKILAIKNKNILRFGENFNRSNKDFLFLTDTGEFLDASNVDKSWIYFLKRCKIEHKKFHALRHTYATLQFEAGKPLITISKLLGHSNIEITSSIYTHVLMKEKQKAISTLALLNN